MNKYLNLQHSSRYFTYRGQVKKRNRRAVKGWPPEIISIDMQNQDLGEKPC